MPDMTEAKKIVARRGRAWRWLVVFFLLCSLLGVVGLLVAPPDVEGWKWLLLVILGAAMAIVLMIADNQGRAARQDLKHGRLISKQTRITSVEYRSYCVWTSGPNAHNFSCHLIDCDCERYELSVKADGQALALSSWLSNVPATIEYLQDSRLVTTVYLEISSHAIMPQSLAFLFDDRKGYTRFVKGKKKE